MNLGEVLGVAVNSKGHVVVLNHPGSAHVGPLYGNAVDADCWSSTRPASSSARSAKASTASATATASASTSTTICGSSTRARTPSMKFNPAGYVTLNLGRRPEGPDEPEDFYYRGGRGGRAPVHVDGILPRPDRRRVGLATTTSTSATATPTRASRSSTSTATGSSRGDRAAAAAAREREPGQFNTPHNIGIDRQNNVYVADRGNRRIQVFDTRRQVPAR